MARQRCGAANMCELDDDEAFDFDYDEEVAEWEEGEIREEEDPGSADGPTEVRQVLVRSRGFKKVARPLGAQGKARQSNGGRPKEEACMALLHQKGHMPIRLEILLPWLRIYPDSDKACMLEWGFREGFRMGYQGPRGRRWADSLRSAIEQPQVVRGKRSVAW
ncbi:hypothetical protein NDU88_007757 [Pleurodeles waltl]|uniref:Uncharacterized protein n=1 Tax=Pleurodeles waltl TaxID=8319 RepID=A0AAV7NCB7_PLEWA|nr:hypothetical protein NDU88_007757 [Pleurodeles waltl]